MCPYEPAPPPSAVGWFDEHRIHFDLCACAARGLGGHAVADIRILLTA